jgi:cytochrome c biogenesis protein CcdA
MKTGNIILAVYILFGIYLVNMSFSFVVMPEILENYNSWIYLIAGLLLIFAGFKFLKKGNAPANP